MKSGFGDWFDSLAINERIKNLDDSNLQKYNKFCRVVAIMKERLDDTQWFLPIAYTPHDFSHHVQQVLINASHLLALDLEQFSIDELLALQYACVLHDIDMAYNPYQRKIHGYNGAYILSPYATALTDETTKNSLEEKFVENYAHLNDVKGCGNLPSEEIMEPIRSISDTVSKTINYILADAQLADAISRIILGHSDIKIDSDCRINTLDKAYYDDLEIPLGKNQAPMRLRTLAAILRLADELDCSKQRIQGILTTSGYPSDSQKHWDKLKIINSIKIYNRHIALHIDNCIKEYIGTTFDGYELLSEIEKKICQEFNTVAACMKEEEQSIVYALTPFDWPKGYNQQKAYEEYKEKQTQKKHREEEQQVYRVDALIELIKCTIDEKGLYREVHQSVADGKCIRNHLDCNGLLTKHQVVDGVAQVFVNVLFTGSFSTAPASIPENNYVLLGVANSGALIASRISAMTGIPFAYYVPPHKESKYSEHEKNLDSYSELFAGKEIVVIIGINHTGAAIASAVNEINKLAKETHIKLSIKKVLGIINRDCTDVVKGNNDQSDESSTAFEQALGRILPESTEYLMTGYPIEICSINADPKRTCPYGKKCKDCEED